MNTKHRLLRIMFIWIIGITLFAMAGHYTTASAAITSVRIRELDGIDVTNYPVTISQVFKKGDVWGDISASLMGQTVPAQTNILRHYDDGSVKHALISLILSELGAYEEITLDLYDGGSPPAGDNIGITDLLSTDFDAQVIFNMPEEKTISARDLIAEGNYTVRYQGPIASEFILQGQPVDEFGNPDPDLQVEFVLRRYKDIPGARVDIAVDNTFTELDQVKRQGYNSPSSDGDITYDTTISLGSSNPQIVYQKNNVTHYFAARWRKVFWWNYTPGNVQIKPDIDYLISTKVIPDYDTSISVSPPTDYEPYDILENGIIEDYFPTTGERGDLGPYPSWAASYIFSQNPEAEERLLDTGNLAGSFSIHFKKKDVNRIYSIDDDPLITLVGGAYGHHPLERSGTSPYTVDRAHQPSLAYIPYLLTGDKYYLDEMYHWANYCMVWHNPGYRANEKGLISPDQVRGEAWSLRQLVDAAAFAPDGTYEKMYFDEKIRNNLENWTQKFLGPPEMNPFGWYGWNDRGWDGVSDARYYTAPWESDFLIWSLDHAIRAGYTNAATPRNWLMKFRIGLFTNGPDYDPMNGAPYKLYVADKEGRHYTTWKELWEKTFSNGREGLGLNPNYAYVYYARACLTISVRDNLPNALEAYNFLGTQLGDVWRQRYVKWAFKGPEPEPDDIPPAGITDLNASLGERAGYVNLSWTATGDDGTEGQAQNYIVKYADFEITDSNWDNATTYDQNITPKQAGQTESLEIKGLTSNTTYYFAIRAQDNFANLSDISNVPSVLIPEDTDAPLITEVLTRTIKDTEAIITWMTDEPATSQVEYGLDTNYGSTSNLDTSYVTDHQVTITGLSPSTTYHYRVKSKDQSNNETTSSDYTFKTSDFTPPVISNVQRTNVESMQATVTWQTDEPSTSQVEYGETISYGSQSEIDTNLVTSHTVTLTGLEPDTIYHFRVKSKDMNDNEGKSDNATFQTPPFGGKIETWGENEISDYKDTCVDTWLYGRYTRGKNFGDDSEISVFSDYEDRQGLIWFDLSEIPSGSTISKAILKLYPTVSNGSGVKAYRVIDPDKLGTDYPQGWSPSGVSYNWRDNQTQTEWAKGAENYQGAIGEVVAEAEVVGGVPIWDITEAVQGWVNSDYPNQGVFLRNGYRTKFASSEYEDAAKRPVLEISYIPSSTTLGKPGKPIHVDD